MIIKFFIIIVFHLIIFSVDLYATEKVYFSSESHQTKLVELFTSQGCSSCPPAEHWLNRFENSQLLWNEIVPIAFHVDYWDKLGWPDPFANHAHSMRQYRYRQQNHLSSVYTPGVLVNGKEWRGWISGKSFPDVTQDVGKLSFVASLDNIEVTYSQISKDTVLNVALLGSGIYTEVARGENKNKTLEQNFVVLTHKMFSYAKVNDSGDWSIPMLSYMLEGVENKDIKKFALAIWVSSTDSIAPIQATGHWLPAEWFEGSLKN